MILKYSFFKVYADYFGCDYFRSVDMTTFDDTGQAYIHYFSAAVQQPQCHFDRYFESGLYKLSCATVRKLVDTTLYDDIATCLLLAPNLMQFTPERIEGIYRELMGTTYKADAEAVEKLSDIMHSLVSMSKGSQHCLFSQRYFNQAVLQVSMAFKDMLRRMNLVTNDVVLLTFAYATLLNWLLMRDILVVSVATDHVLTSDVVNRLRYFRLSDMWYERDLRERIHAGLLLLGKELRMSFGGHSIELINDTLVMNNREQCLRWELNLFYCRVLSTVLDKLDVVVNIDKSKYEALALKKGDCSAYTVGDRCVYDTGKERIIDYSGSYVGFMYDCDNPFLIVMDGLNDQFYTNTTACIIEEYLSDSPNDLQFLYSELSRLSSNKVAVDIVAKNILQHFTLERKE